MEQWHASNVNRVGVPVFFLWSLFLFKQAKDIKWYTFISKKKVFLLLILELLLLFGQILHEFPLNSQNIEGRLKLFTFIFRLYPKMWRVFKFFIFLFCLWPDLDKSSYGWLPLQQQLHHKIKKRRNLGGSPNSQDLWWGRCNDHNHVPLIREVLVSVHLMNELQDDLILASDLGLVSAH